MWVFTPLEDYDVVVAPLAGKSSGEEFRVNVVTWAIVNRLDFCFGPEVSSVLRIDVPIERVDCLLVFGSDPVALSRLAVMWVLWRFFFDSLAVRMIQSLFASRYCLEVGVSMAQLGFLPKQLVLLTR